MKLSQIFFVYAMILIAPTLTHEEGRILNIATIVVGVLYAMAGK